MSIYLRKHWPSMVDERHKHGGTAILERPMPARAVATPTKPKTPEPLPDFVASLLSVPEIPQPEPGEAEYEALCAELGFRPYDLTIKKSNREEAIAKRRLYEIGIQVNSKLQSKRIPRYDEREVSDYMTAITPDGMKWGWVPFGHTEQVPITGVIFNHRIEDLWPVRDVTYEKLVPIHILRRIKVVKELFAADDPKFYVTDYEVPNPDPFVKVVVHGYSAIFGVWDEPGFGDLKTEV